MKESQLRYLIQEIVRCVLKEYSSMAATNASQSSMDEEPDRNVQVSPDEQPSEAEMDKLRRDKRVAIQRDIKQTQTDLSAKKKQMDFYKQSKDQATRFEIPSLTKKLQALKGQI